MVTKKTKKNTNKSAKKTKAKRLKKTNPANTQDLLKALCTELDKYVANNPEPTIGLMYTPEDTDSYEARKAQGAVQTEPVKSKPWWKFW